MWKPRKDSWILNPKEVKKVLNRLDALKHYCERRSSVVVGTNRNLNPSATIVGPTASKQKPTLKSDTSFSSQRLEGVT